MKFINKLKRLVGIKPSLRQLCVERYGEEFGELYDMYCEGKTIGSLLDTILFVQAVEKVRKEMYNK